MTFVFEFVFGMPLKKWHAIPRIRIGRCDDGRWVVVAQALNVTLVVARQDVLCVTEFVGSEAK